MASVTPSISVITLNVNRLNFPIKRHTVAGWIKINKTELYRLPTRDSSD